MAKFDLKGLLNDRSVPDRQQDQKIVYRNPKDLIPSEENFYNTEKLERLKQSIKLLGILQPLLIEFQSTFPRGERRIGHQRYDFF